MKKVFCPVCQKNDQKSMVYTGLGTRTSMYCEPFYDEEGVYHHHDMNRVTATYSCSNGHRWRESWKDKCPGCSWPDEEVAVQILEPNDES